MSNQRLTVTPREHIHGCLEGVDFGYNLSCLARSPRALLLWSSGTTYTSGRMTCYGTSNLIGIPNRSAHWGRHPTYKDIGPGGGRLTMKRVLDASEEIRVLFGEHDLKVVLAVVDAVRNRQTLLIEGGGPRLMPSRRLGHDAYAAWRQEPFIGFPAGNY